MDLTDLIARASEGRDLSAEESEAAFHELMSGRATPVQTAALLVALRTKGHVPSEIAGGVRALRRAMLPVRAPTSGVLIDTCGTGGGAVTTFNISTAAAFVAAGAGLVVAKHGNRSYTSRSGSADVLEALGVRIDLTPEAMGTVLERAGIVFMFAPLLHPAMKHVGPVRKELRMPTIMNLLGPLTNPASVRRQVVGVAESRLVPLVARALEALGHEKALVVHGLLGMDEVSPVGPTLVAEVGPEGLREYEVTPATFGAAEASLSDIPGGAPEENAALIERVVRGEERGGARTVTLLNAAAALYAGGVAEDLPGAFRRAAEVVDSGAAARSLEALRSETRAVSAG
jgi:anthranilate phosphoribosyltransferase